MTSQHPVTLRALSLTTALVVTFFWLVEASAATDPLRGEGGSSTPNILVILLDDVGPEQLQCYDPTFAGSPGVMPGTNLYSSAYPYAPTPNISTLAREGVRFTRGFTAPICSPSRASLMTGRYSFRNQIGQVILANGETQKLSPSNLLPLPGGGLPSGGSELLSRIPELPASEAILPELFQAQAPAYDLGLFGKWHLTAAPCKVMEHFIDYLGDPERPNLPFSSLDVDGEDHPFTAGWPLFRGLRGNLDGKPSVGEERCPGFPPRTENDYFNWFYVQEPQGQGPGWTICTDFEVSSVETCLVTSPPAQGSGIPPISSFPLTMSTAALSNQYLITTIREDVQEFILNVEGQLDDQGNKIPWLAVWTPQACHKPLTWPPQHLHDFGSEPPDVPVPGMTCPLIAKWRRFKAILQGFDTELGNLKNALSAGPGETIWDRTVVILLGDNGTAAPVVKNANEPLTGGLPGITDPYVLAFPYTFDSSIAQHEVKAEPGQPTRFKGSPYVSGSNMICIVRGPGVVAPGRTYGGLIDMVDIFSTIRELAGIPANWPQTWPDPGHTNFKIDGISLCPILENQSPGTFTPRTTSLSLLFAPNGPFDPSPAGDTRNLRAGYAKMYPDGSIYHYIRQQWVEQKGGDWNNIINEPDHFYQLCDSAGNVDTQEVNDLADPLNPPDVLTLDRLAEMSLELDALLASPDVFP